MSRQFYNALKEGIKTGTLGNATSVVDYLDKSTKKQGVVSQLEHFTPENSIKVFGVADKACTPNIPCIDMIDAIVNCGRGIQSVVKTKSNLKCPVKIGIYKGTAVATSNPTKTFSDQSSSTVLAKECFTLTPTLQSITWDIESEIDDCNFSDCGSFKDWLVKKFGEAIFNGNEANLMTTLVANAGASLTLTGGDLLDDLIKLYKEIKKVQTNKNKEIVIFCNQLVIDDLEWLRDDDNNLIF
ncbi:MAG: hypothetical protein ACRCZ2_05405, partial [Fusobacteriaceae bacterium]